ncbi:hypothetical protein RND81_03G051900 [Saponaria officinalis]|uniref:Polyprotein n=1 Tax=Saponaria officinalis TaxID=3572 RepID=A0AAW1M2S8_SAPOF
MDLVSKNKSGFVDGTCKKPEKSDKKYNQWIRCDLLVMRWILNSIEKHILESLHYVQSSKGLWTAILDRYGQTSGVDIYQLKKELSTITQSNQSLFEYYSCLKRTWESIDAFDPLPIERQKQVSDAVDVLTEPNVYATISDSRHFDPKKQRVDASLKGSDVLTYNYCHHPGHIKANCYKLQQCSHCGRKGHATENCYQLQSSTGQRSFRGRGTRRRANYADVVGFGDTSVTIDLTDPLTAHIADDILPAGTPVGLDQGLQDGLVNTIMDKVLHAINEKTTPHNQAMSPVNFTGTITASLINSVSSQSHDVKWIVDIGASDHMISNIGILHSVVPIPRPVLVGLPDGSVKVVHHSGKYQLTPLIELHNMLVVPYFQENLLSVAKLVHGSNMVAHFHPHECFIQDRSSDVIYARAFMEGGLYWITHTTTAASAPSRLGVYSVNTQSCNGELLHDRLGLTSFEKMKHVTAFDFSNKMGYDFSRTTWTYLFQNKFQVPALLKAFVAYVENQFGYDIKVFRSDNGTEFVQGECHSFFQDKGIVHQRSIVGRPQQNGRVERKHRHLLDTARALRLHANLPVKFWGECILTSIYLINKMPTPLLNWKTPYELLMGKTPTYDELRVLDSLCCASMPITHRDKFGARARRCVFLGYPFGQKGYKSSYKNPSSEATGQPQSILVNPAAGPPVSKRRLNHCAPYYSTLDTVATDATSDPITASVTPHGQSSSDDDIFQPSSEPSSGAHIIPDVDPPIIRIFFRPKQLSNRLTGYTCPVKLPGHAATAPSQPLNTTAHASLLQNLTDFDPKYLASLNNVFSEFEPYCYFQAKDSPQ